MMGFGETCQCEMNENPFKETRECVGSIII